MKLYVRLLHTCHHTYYDRDTEDPWYECRECKQHKSKKQAGIYELENSWDKKFSRLENIINQQEKEIADLKKIISANYQFKTQKLPEITEIN